MLEKIRPESRPSIMHNTMIKTYRDGSKQVIFATHQIFREPGWEAVPVYSVNQNPIDQAAAAFWGSLKQDDSADDLLDPDLDWRNLPVEEMTVGQLAMLDDADAFQDARKRESLKRAMRRARVRVRDYCLSTDMRYFATFTLDRQKVDRYDIHAITKKLNVWLGHQVQRKGIAYVMVPELHQDGAVHFHGMLTEGLQVVDSGTIIPKGDDRPRRPRSDAQARAWVRDGGRVVYNLPDWPYGFTTALQVTGCYEQAVNYISKYISKGLHTESGLLPQKVGGRWYYSGGPLGRPGMEYVNVDPGEQLQAYGEAAHQVDLGDALDGVEAYIVWITSEGVPK